MHLLGLLLLRSLGGSSSLLLLLLLEVEERVDLVGDVVLLGDDAGDLLAAHESGDNAGTDYEGQDETVHAVPLGGKALDGSTSVVVVEEGEGKELGDQGVLNGEQQSRPGHGGGNDTGSVAPVASAAAVSSPLQTPVDSSEEGEDLCRN